MSTRSSQAPIVPSLSDTSMSPPFVYLCSSYHSNAMELELGPSRPDMSSIISPIPLSNSMSTSPSHKLVSQREESFSFPRHNLKLVST